MGAGDGEHRGGSRWWGPIRHKDSGEWRCGSRAASRSVVEGFRFHSKCEETSVAPGAGVCHLHTLNCRSSYSLVPSDPL